jgi:hypothetical protein
MANVYYSPEDFNLAPLAELELTEPCYSFDTLVVWQHITTDELYWQHDAGCSCPTPFEDYASLDDLYLLGTHGDYMHLEEMAKTADDKAAMRTFLRKVRRAMASA